MSKSIVLSLLLLIVPNATPAQIYPGMNPTTVVCEVTRGDRFDRTAGSYTVSDATNSLISPKDGKFTLTFLNTVNEDGQVEQEAMVGWDEIGFCRSENGRNGLNVSSTGQRLTCYRTSSIFSAYFPAGRIENGTFRHIMTNGPITVFEGTCALIP